MGWKYFECGGVRRILYCPVTEKGGDYRLRRRMSAAAPMPRRSPATGIGACVEVGCGVVVSVPTGTVPVGAGDAVVVGAVGFVDTVGYTVGVPAVGVAVGVGLFTPAWASSSSPSSAPPLSLTTGTGVGGTTGEVSSAMMMSLYPGVVTSY